MIIFIKSLLKPLLDIIKAYYKLPIIIIIPIIITNPTTLSSLLF